MCGIKNRIILVLIIYLLALSASANIKPECNTDSVRSYLRLYQFWGLEDYNAIDSLSRCLMDELQSGIDTVIYLLGRRYSNFADNYIDSILLRIHPDSNTIADCYYFRAYIIMQQQSSLPPEDSLHALQFFDSALSYNMDYDLAWFNVGVLCLKNKDSIRALECFRKAVDLKGSLPLYWTYYSIANIMFNDSEIGRLYADSANKYSDQSASFYYKTGQIYCDFCLYDESSWYFNIAATLFPQIPEYWHSLGLSEFFRDSTSQYKQYFDSSLSHILGASVNTINMAMPLYSYKIYDYALKYLDTQLIYDGTDKWAWYYKAYTLGGLNEYDESLECMDSMIKYDAENARLFPVSMKSMLLIDYGRYEEALKALDLINLDSLEDDNSKSLYYMGRSECYLNLGELRMAKTMCDSIMKYAEDSDHVRLYCDSVKALGN